MSELYLNADEPVNQALAERPETVLEHNMIAEYLLNKGYRLQDLDALPEETAKKLMGEASRSASLKLSEIEARNRFRQEIRAPGG